MPGLLPLHIAATVLIAACLHALHSREHAPANLPKDAASFDLPMALGTLIGSGQVASDKLAEYAIVGELALDGSMRPTKGALSMAIAAGEDKTLRGLIVPAESAAEAAVVEGVEVIAVQSLAQAVAFLAGEIEISPPRRGWMTSSANCRIMRSISPTSAARRWPSGQSSSRPREAITC